MLVGPQLKEVGIERQHKVSGPNLVKYLKWVHVFEGCVIRCGSKILQTIFGIKTIFLFFIFLKMSSKEIGLSVQNLYLTLLNSITNIIEKVYVIEL